MNNIGTNFEINLDLKRTIDASPEALSKYKLVKGDILFNNTNSTSLVGKSAIFNKSELCLYSNHLTRLRVNRRVVLPEWILFYLRARWLKRDFERMCHKWINQASVTTERFKKLEIPVPPLQIQKTIMQNLQNVSKTISHIKEKSRFVSMEVARTQEALNTLPKRIMNLAFTGELH